ncbi:MAG: hypothetical protein WDO70_11995 [Alphaproteobacteria bacterium]
MTISPRIPNAVLTGLAVFLLAQAPPQQTPAKLDDSLQKIIGVTWLELQACASTADCVLIKDFVGCCTERPVNMKYTARIEQDRDLLHEKLTPEADLARCISAQCIPPSAQVACNNSLCEAVSMPARLLGADAINIARETMAKEIFDADDFGVPTFTFDRDHRVWRLNFGPRLSTHVQKMKDEGRDIGYYVIVDDANERAAIKTYEITPTGIVAIKSDK